MNQPKDAEQAGNLANGQEFLIRTLHLRKGMTTRKKLNQENRRQIMQRMPSNQLYPLGEKMLKDKRMRKIPLR